MRDDSPRWREINPSAWEHERAGLRQLKVLLPDADPYAAWANVEFVGTDGSVNEIDLLVLTPSGLYVLELKHWQGEISGDGSRWRVRSPQGRTRSEDNPLLLANRKAKRLASLLQHYARQHGRGMRVPFVRAAIFLHAPNVRCRLDEVGRQWVYGLPTDPRPGLESILSFLTRRPTDARDLVDRTRGREIVALIESAGLRPSVAGRTVQNLLLHPKPYAEGIGWQDYLAGHPMDTSLVRRVRFYLTSRAATDDREAIQRAAEREFRLLQGIHHPGIAHPVDLVDHEFGPAVIFEHDPDAVRLDHWLAERGERLTVEQRLTLVRDLAEIMRYAHTRHLVHRNLSPRTVLVCDPDRPRPRLLVTDWQAGGRVAATTTQPTLLGGTEHVDQFADPAARLYLAPEALTNPDAPGQLLDVFALGAIGYTIFAGRPPASSAEELTAIIRERGGLELTAAADGTPTSLEYLVYDATAGDTSRRTPSVAKLLAHLDEVEDELTAPEPEPVTNPLDARPGDVLDGGFTVGRRLGAGATAVALLVEREGEAAPLVLKVARHADKHDRIDAEADRLRPLRHWQVAQLVEGPVSVGGHAALLLEYAGDTTLAETLAAGGRLSLDLLERYGKDLLDIVGYLDGMGVAHRDIKPANLAARPRPKDKQPHLCIFDFSLAAVPADQLSAGTAQYLDPFLGPPRRPRYDAAAERFAVAVTLFEMATGTLPRWGDGVANPAAVAGEVTLTETMFDPAVATRMVAFFRRALAREAKERFDTVDEMADHWRAIFRELPAAGDGAPPPAPDQPMLTSETPLDLVGLTARARSALERFGVRTVGDLVAYDAFVLSRLPGVPQATKTEIRRRAKELRLFFAPAPAGKETGAEPAEAGLLLVRGIDTLAAALVPKQTTRNHTEAAALRVLLGLLPAPHGDGTPLRWPTLRETATALEVAPSQLSAILAKWERRWAGNANLAAVRDEIVALLEDRGGVMAATEVAEALIAARGSYADEPLRTAQAVGVVRAATEAEFTRGGDARLAIRRFGAVVLLGREPDDPTATHTAIDLLEYAVVLGRVAQRLATADPLPTPARALERLRGISAPAAMPPLADARLMHLAAAAVDVAVNAQLQLYPVGLAPDRAVRLAAGSLVLNRDQTLTVECLRNRVLARFPRAAPLPDRPGLDRLLAECEIPLEWDATARVYRALAVGSTGIPHTSTRWAGPLVAAGQAAVEEADTRLTGALDRRAFLAVLVGPRQLTAARRALLARLPLTEVDVTRLLVQTLRALGVPWQLVLDSDAHERTHPDRRHLENAVRHEVVPRITETIDAAPGAVLITEAAPLARYDCMALLARLADTGVPRPAARLLLAPGRRASQPLLDATPIPVTSPSQWLWLPPEWLDAAPARTP